MNNRKNIVALASTLVLYFNAAIIMMFIFGWTGSKLFTQSGFFETVFQAIVLGGIMFASVGVINLVSRGIFKGLQQTSRATNIIRILLSVIGGSVGVWFTAMIFPGTIHAATIFDGLFFSFFQYLLLTTCLVFSSKRR